MEQPSIRRDESDMQGESDSLKLGVLFVHGIGEQREGDTLTAFGEPIIDWIRQWVSGHGMLAFREPMRAPQQKVLRETGARPDGVEVEKAWLFPSRRQSVDPPHGLLHIRYKSDDGNAPQREQTWLLAESWWGEQMQAPPVFSLLGWLYSRGPWVAMAHFAERAMRVTRPAREQMRNRSSRWGKILSPSNWRQLIWPVATLQFVLAAALLQLLLIVATVVALIPIPAVRRYVSVILQQATSILGDSYGLVANDTQRGAILRRFEETVAWLQGKCEKLVIVAHSQGAAVVNEAINDRRIPAADLLITFGAGLTKLQQLRQCEVARRGRLLAAGWIVPSLVVAVCLQIWILGADHEVGDFVPGLIAIYLAALSCMIAAFTAWRETRVQTRDAGESAPKRWVDFYASSDPVPQGPLHDHLPHYALTSERIINRRSFLSDHTAYWENKPGFVSRVVAELDRVAELLKIPDLSTSVEYRRALKHHGDSILVLSFGWWSFVLSLGFWLVFSFDRLASAGAALLAGLHGTPLEFIEKSVAAPGALIMWAAKQLTGSVPAKLVDAGHASIALGAAVLAGYLWWKSVLVVFTKWNRASLADFFAYGNAKYWGRYGTLLVWPFMDLLAFLPPAIAFCLWAQTSPWQFILTAVSYVVILIYSVLVLYTVYDSTPKDLPAMRRLLTKIKGGLLEVTEPGSDSATADRRGWAAWADFRNLASLVLTVVVLVVLVVDRFFKSGENVSGVAMAGGVALIDVLLWARMIRLMTQRGYGTTFSSVACTIGMIAIVVGLETTRTQDGSTLPPWVALPMMMLPVSALAYFFVDRLIPKRMRAS